ncbi:hypothetical protein SAMN05216262_12716 [Colwellia chukchiensis]|uniref:Ion channel n=1 Tax=Colwellia chukchiensis TaxID=641665 RepID=A0A1H7TN70_9GAMM|nr:hypothetical protein [Colwellia chukchiensis]SEL86211.1 hypothetical protein SAMN05216262_12716 [Colwellia chukchiensis]
MYENKSKPLASKKAFQKRLFFHVLIAILLVLITLIIGILGHIYFDDMQVTNAFVASITLVSGLGLSILPETTAGQVFASIYGMLSSYIYVATSSIVLAPVFHRILHKFHLDESY